MHDLKFTDADLKANRSGYLTENQRAEVQSTLAYYGQVGKRTMWGFALIIPVLMGIGLLIESNNSAIPMTAWLPGYAIFSAAIFAFVMAASAFGRFNTYRRGRDAREELISQVEGIVKLKIAPRSTWNRYPSFSLSVINRGGMGLTVFRFSSEKFAKYFVEGERYRVYYLRFPPLHIALSAEPLRYE